MTRAQSVASPHEHAVSYYANDHEATTALVRFVFDGLAREERVVVVASAARLAAVEEALGAVRDSSLTEDHMASGCLMLDAARALDGFMVAGVPDPERFRSTIGALVELAAADGAHVRVYGEMVALLWEEGNVAGALALEELWNELAVTRAFSLLCGYQVGALRDAGLDDVRRVCELHDSVNPPASYGSPTAPTWMDPSVDEYSEVFLPVTQAVPALRRFVTAALHLWDLEELVGDARLVASELGTNALVHCVSPFRASVEKSPAGVRISIQDLGAGVPALLADSVDGLGGRGVAIIDQVADVWGCEDLPGGKVTWAELRCPAPIH